MRELFTEELTLALPPGHPLTRKRKITLADLEKERLIVMKEGHCLGDQMLAFCERRDSKPNINFPSAQLETIQALVCCGMGISLIPAMAVRNDRELAGIPFAGATSARTEDCRRMAKAKAIRTRRRRISETGDRAGKRHAQASHWHK